MNLDIKYYLTVFWRRFHYFALGFVLVLALAGAAAFLLPPSYESDASLLLESPQIPEKLAAPTVTTTDLEQLQVLQQRLLTRDNLLSIARQYNVYRNMANMSPDDIVAAMNKDTSISNRTGRGQASIMDVSFLGRTGQISAAVVNEYVTRLLNMSVQLRTGQAQQTLDFFKQEVDRLGSKLNEQSAKILAFQNANRGALPNTLNYRLTQQSTLQTQMASTQRQIADLKDQKQRLVALFDATGQLSPSASDAQMTPQQKQLAALKNQLTQAQAIFSDTNPKIVMLKQQIAQLEKAQVSAQKAETAKTDSAAKADGAEAAKPTSPQQSMLDIQTAQIDGQISQLQAQQKDMKDQLAALKTSIEKTADNQVTLDSLQRDYDNAQAQYNAAVARLSDASTGERMATLSKGQRLAVLDPATVPDQPSKPNRKKIVLLGLLGGIALGFGLIVLRELLDMSMRRPADLTAALGVTPLASIPYLRTPGELVRRRSIIASVLIAVAIAVPAAMWAVNTYYMPLDLVAAKITAKLGG